MPCKNNWNPNAAIRLQNLLGICRKAGKLELGAEPSVRALTAGRLYGVLVCLDTSEKSRKEARFHCARAGVPCLDIPLTKQDVGRCAGRGAGVLGVSDEGFFRRMAELSAADAWKSGAVTT